VGKFVIASEDAIAKGIRRMYALTGPEAERAIHRADRLEQRVAQLVKTIEADKSLVNDRDRYRATNRQIFDIIDVSTIFAAPLFIVRIFRMVNRKSIDHPSIECRALSNLELLY
jgi:hypothetical protein